MCILLFLTICFSHIGVLMCKQHVNTSIKQYKYYTKVGPKFPPSKGEVWPAPQWEMKNKYAYFVYHSSKFNVEVINNSCDLLTRAINRYKNTMSNMELIQSFNYLSREMDSDILSKRVLKKLNVILFSECEELPHYEMKERYKLTVGRTSELASKSIWGILRGLETFSQLFYLADDYSEIRINITTIIDFPRYKHRGLLIDTGRHYLSLSNIYKTIDAMAMNKMNVLHWHLMDDQSFPYQSERYPTLSKKGAFFPTMVYTKADILAVVAFARDRGIRVIPEVDVPGHTLSWGEAFPNILTECYSGNKTVIFGPLDPSKNETYELLEKLFYEVHQWFPDEFLHIGGDEVTTYCWESNLNITKFMEKNHLAPNQLQGYFMRRAIRLLPNQTRPLVWQEVFDMNALPEQKTHIQVWNWGWVDEMIKILQAGHYVIFSASWYLNYKNQGWDEYYRKDPRQMVFKKINSSIRVSLENIVGGEACLWGEMVDNSNLHLKLWPRASAIAERLWTGLAYDAPNPVNDRVRSRIEEQSCRMKRRGIPAEPASGPSFCVGTPPEAG